MTTYIAHATRNHGKEIAFNMPYTTKPSAVCRLIDILVDELGNGEGDLKSHLPEIANTFYEGKKYSYADCDYWIEEKSEKGEPQIVWVLKFKSGKDSFVEVFKEKEAALARVPMILEISGNHVTMADLFILCTTSRLSTGDTEVLLESKEVQ